jgi:hypothetical protein
VFINLHIENDFIQKITQVKYINSLCSFEHHELEHKLCICVLRVSTLPMIYKFVVKNQQYVVDVERRSDHLLSYNT